MPNLIDRVAADLNVPKTLVSSALQNAFSRYRKVHIPKKSGGFRVALQPSSELKMIQAWLLNNLLLNLPVSSISTAFGDGCSTLRNARIHTDGLYSLKLDLENFFPSIRFDDLKQLIVSRKSSLHEATADEDFFYVLQRSCFTSDNRMPVGYMTSPAIANAVMLGFDQALELAITSDKDRFGDARISRYADDFIFSTNKAGACKEFLSAFLDLIAKTNSPKLTLNKSKTRFMSLRGGSTMVTGLRITQQGRVRVHSRYRDHVRLLLKLYSKNKLQKETLHELRGHLSYIEFSDPQLFTKISFRYHREISALRAKGKLPFSHP